MPDRREGVAALFGLADHRLVPGGIDVGLHRGGIEPAELLEPLAPGRGVEPGDRAVGFHLETRAGLDAESQARRVPRPEAAAERARLENCQQCRYPRPSCHPA